MFISPFFTQVAAGQTPTLLMQPKHTVEAAEPTKNDHLGWNDYFNSCSGTVGSFLYHFVNFGRNLSIVCCCLEIDSTAFQWVACELAWSFEWFICRWMSLIKWMRATTRHIAWAPPRPAYSGLSVEIQSLSSYPLNVVVFHDGDLYFYPTFDTYSRTIKTNTCFFFWKCGRIVRDSRTRCWLARSAMRWVWLGCCLADDECRVARSNNWCTSAHTM